MLTLAKPDNRVIKILGRNGVDASRDYRLSSYVVYCYSEPGRHLIKSTMTGGIYLLSDEEWKDIDPSVNPIVSGSVFEASGLSELVSSCVFVYTTDGCVRSESYGQKDRDQELYDPAHDWLQCALRLLL